MQSILSAGDRSDQPDSCYGCVLGKVDLINPSSPAVKVLAWARQSEIVSPGTGMGQAEDR